MGHGKHILTFPVNHGKTLNLVAFRTTSEDWPDAQKLTRPGQREELLREFEDYGPTVIKLLKLVRPKLDVVSNSS
jgi:salicylate hydroxylase